MRLDQWLAHAGNITRKQARDACRSGRVFVDGMVVKQPQAHIAPDAQVSLDGETLQLDGARYIMLHKPEDVVSSTRDPHTPTALSLLPVHMQDLFPVGRLDKDATGLLLFTDDGPAAHRMISPKWGLNKVYRVQVEGRFDTTDIDAFKQGIALKDFTARPALLAPLDYDEATGLSHAEVTVHEGKFHQVKRMCAARGKQVVQLKRIRFGPLSLDTALAPGEFRALTQAEKEALLAAIAHKGGENDAP